MKSRLDFILNGERVSLADEDASRTLLTWLRERRGLAGTKEGCAEGDCGACTVVLAQLSSHGKLEYLPVNSCILSIGALEGKEVITVEGLKHGAIALVLAFFLDLELQLECAGARQNAQSLRPVGAISD